MELWKKIEEFPDYEVSTRGGVRRVGKTKNMFQGYTQNGYKYIILRKNKRKHRSYVHRLVAKAFLKKKKGLEIVHHKNRTRDDNRLENLEWSSPKLNAQDRKYDMLAITQNIIRLHNKGYTAKEISKMVPTRH